MSAPGWYPDPHDRAPLRWWDGAVWTHWSAAPGMTPWPDAAIATVDVSTIDPRSAPPAPAPDPAADPPAPVPPPAQPTPASVPVPPAPGASAAPPLAPPPGWGADPTSGPAPSEGEEVRPGKAVARLVAQARTALAALAEAAQLEAVRHAEARAAFERVREAEAVVALDQVGLDSLAAAAGGGLRTRALLDAGHRSAGDVLRAGRVGLLLVPGVGEQTADRLLSAARAAQARAAERARVVLDAAAPTPLTSALVVAVVAWDQARRATAARGSEWAGLAHQLQVLADAAQPATSRIGMWFRGRSKEQALRAASSLAGLLAAPGTGALLDELGALRATRPDEPAAWAELSARGADLQALLALLGETGATTESRTGHLPAEIVAAVEALELDTSLLSPDLQLRGYQRFGAQFALVQRRVILGDEMGLGKTIQALAALAHLASEGQTHFAVICPAAVVVNWTREVTARSRLTAIKVHGDDKAEAFARWQAEGGVAITTYETAKGLAPGPFGGGTAPPVALLVVDECHFVKNPSTQRTKAVRTWVGASERVLYMSGTPMENRVGEFKVLVGHLQPELASGLRVDDGLLGADAFRQAVAPVYLRRNQEDVLTELPARLDTDAWVEMVGADLDAYRRAVAEGSFMAMRRAAFSPGTVEGSAKLDALVDICDEAAEEGLKVVVFSFFRDVLDTVVATLGERAVGPVTGDAAPAQRQELVDLFTAAPGHAVLVGQIEAAGVGLNIQAGSVVVLCEPQWKPSTEEQAIARCHRMGQVRRVQVHRLLAGDSVDEHMRRLVAGKAELVEAHVGTSTVAQASPAAVDPTSPAAVDPTSPAAIETIPPAGPSQTEAEEQIIAAERERLAVGPVAESSREQP